MNTPVFEAALLDMDGVITQTATLHARAWKQMFDEYLARHAERNGEPLVPFDQQQDYWSHVDGKPRLDGIRDFLESRGIRLPAGTPEDPAGEETVYGLGRRKNLIFLDLLESDGVEVWPDSLEQLRRWKRDGWKLAVFSSSKNCQHVLDAAGLSDFFDVRVDGNDLERLGIPGKPAPDMILQACELLGVAPAKAIVVEDAVAGIEAARQGGFGMVIGVAREKDPGGLRAAGADRIVEDLRNLQDLTPSSTKLAEITERLAGQSIALFLDYDGTLTPIVRRPEEAILSDARRQLLSRLAEQCTVAIVSGRDRLDVARMVGLDQLIYAGSHGFDIAGPGGLEMQHEEAAEALDDLDSAEAALRDRLHGIPGARVERKKFAIATHYREVDTDRDVARIEQAVDQVVQNHVKLRRRTGKKIIELQPDVEWDKGHAVAWLRDALQLGDDTLVVYLGDDVTDEDAFRMLQTVRWGIGIRVGPESGDTEARYSVNDCEQVETLLTELLRSLTRQGATRKGAAAG